MFFDVKDRKAVLISKYKSIPEVHAVLEKFKSQPERLQKILIMYILCMIKNPLIFVLYFQIEK